MIYFNSLECDKPLGMQSGAIKDKQISASSEYNANFGAKYARLNIVRGGGSWAAKTKDARQWLQIDLGNTNFIISRVATQGRATASQWVKKYRLQYSNNGRRFQYYKAGRRAKVKCIKSTKTVRF